MMEQPENTQWYTVAKACDYLDVSKTTLYEYMKDERLPFYYMAGTRNRRLRKSDLDALMVRGNPKDSAEDD